MVVDRVVISIGYKICNRNQCFRVKLVPTVRGEMLYMTETARTSWWHSGWWLGWLEEARRRHEAAVAGSESPGEGEDDVLTPLYAMVS